METHKYLWILIVLLVALLLSVLLLMFVLTAYGAGHDVPVGVNELCGAVSRSGRYGLCIAVFASS